MYIKNKVIRFYTGCFISKAPIHKQGVGDEQYLVNFCRVSQTCSHFIFLRLYFQFGAVQNNNATLKLFNVFLKYFVV